MPIADIILHINNFVKTWEGWGKVLKELPGIWSDFQTADKAAWTPGVGVDALLSSKLFK